MGPSIAGFPPTGPQRPRPTAPPLAHHAHHARGYARDDASPTVAADPLASTPAPKGSDDPAAQITKHGDSEIVKSVTATAPATNMTKHGLDFGDSLKPGK